MRPLAVALALPLAAALAGALVGRVWAPLDSLAIVQPYLVAALLALVLLGALPSGLRIGLGALAALAAWDILRLAMPERAAPGATLTHLQHNLHPGNRAPDLLDRLESVDTATLQEVLESIHVLADRSDDMALTICPRPGWVTTAVLSRLPVLDRGCTPSGAAWMRIAAPDCFGGHDEITVVSVHLYWPWPAEGDRQMRQVSGLAEEIAALPRPILLGGDLNQMPWSGAAGRLADAAEGRVAGGLHATYTLADGWLRLPIDHVIAGGDLRAETERGGLHGSDHHAVTARVTASEPSGC